MNKPKDMETVIFPLPDGTAQMAMFDADDNRWHLLEGIYHFDASDCEPDNDGDPIKPQNTASV